MNYVNFEDQIVQRFGIDLIGWPGNVKFVNPSEMSDSIAPLQELSAALSDGTCKFVTLSLAEQNARRERIAADEAAGRTAPRKPRKQRKDAGVVRGSRKGKGSANSATGNLETENADVEAEADSSSEEMDVDGPASRR